MADLAKTNEAMNAIAGAIDNALNGNACPKQVAFVLLVMPFDGPEDARTNYISNARREDVLVMLKEVTARFEGQPEQSGRA
jgi:hypothetical protein